MKLYITTKDLIGFDPNGPDFFCNDDGTRKIPKGTILQSTEYFDEYTMEFLIVNTTVTVGLNRQIVCDNVKDSQYYMNYFTLPDGLFMIYEEESLRKDE